MDTAHWPQHQDIGSLRSMEELVVTSSASNNNTTTTIRPQQQQPQQQQVMERRVRPEKEQALNCPRCNSTNTKFCYYNNYSLTQPRYFCKTCRRYWTAGGSLRNVPVGGGSRKNKRSSASSSTSSAPAAEATSISSAAKKLLSEQNPSKFQQEGQDLNLAFPALHHEFRVGVGIGESSSTNPTAAVVTGSGAMSAMELLRSPFMQQMPMSLPMPEYPSGFGIQDLRANTTLSFPLHGHGGGGGYGGLQETGGNASGSRLLFPFEESSTNRGHVSSSSAVTEQKGQQDPPGFWNGMIGGGGGSW